MRNRTGRSLFLVFGQIAKTGAMAAVLAGACVMNGWAQTGWSPEKNVEFIIGAGPGSQLDTVARRVMAIWDSKHLVTAPVTAVNKAGGSQAIAAAYLLGHHPGDGNCLQIFAPTLMTSYLIGNHNFDYRRATPLAFLGSEYYVWVVGAGSDIASGRDFLERLRKDPASLSIGTSNIGGIGHIQMLAVLKAAGVDVGKLKVVGFKGGGEARTALLGGHIDASSTSGSNMVAYKQSGQVRVIAVNAPRRLGGVYADVPTWKEQGVDTHIISIWIGILGAEKLSEAQVAYWDDAFGKMVKTDDWIKDAERYLRSREYRNSSETSAFLKAEHEALSKLVNEMGLVRRRK